MISFSTCWAYLFRASQSGADDVENETLLTSICAEHLQPLLVSDLSFDPTVNPEVRFGVSQTPQIVDLYDPLGVAKDQDGCGRSSGSGLVHALMPLVTKTLLVNKRSVKKC